MKAFLGTGLLGSNFVKAMIKHGDEVQVWNRTAAKAKALQEFGAKAFDDVAEAVKGADTIHVTLKDDDTVNEVLAAACKGFSPGVTIIDHTTTSAKGAIERTAEWKAKGYTYLHAPVFMGPINALESSGNMLVSGDQGVISRVEPELSKMTGKVINFGSEEGKAAGMKLMGNLFLLTLTAGISDTLAFAKGLNIPASDVSALFDSWNPAAMMPTRLKKITEGNFSNPSWELSMARKDAGLMLQAAKENNTKLAVIPAIAAEMDSWIEKGYGNSDWSVIAKDNI
ncbi:3-hydroxyisobutyrate dehydrogenase [Mucilaginibacter mallensis]|uniref:3-hydroxyisobutyrate dehydrogenase n=1 Tax=Mucilaginibacter mallensis TaxID=652787 RepID=A0A1H1WB10_MUCMA|nr:NAD(P)-dependent oxidoreductase [Mucilaginibacter mallensis]SDS94152.1 3-hydroxyisobutyrate dehydrogenase [Mucilaginibacter mallensis]